MAARATRPPIARSTRRSSAHFCRQDRSHRAARDLPIRLLERSERREAERMTAGNHRLMRALADRGRPVATGSLLVREAGTVRNVSVDASDGTRRSSRRYVDPVRMAREHERFAGGNERLIVELHGMAHLPARRATTCASRAGRATATIRRQQRLEYDLLIYVANRPSARRQRVAHAAGRAGDREPELLHRSQSRRRRTATTLHYAGRQRGAELARRDRRR